MSGATRDPAVRRLYEKAKQLGTWNPADVDLTEDARQWHGLTEDERAFVGRIVALFAGGEEAVTRDLLPLALAVVRERWLDDELFVTAWLWEEGKHADFFGRYLSEVVGGQPPGTRPGARLFDVELADVMGALLTDSSPPALVRAVATYCLIVEGVLADTGQGALEEALTARGLLPGLRAGLRLVNRDESRHVAYGFRLMRRLIARDASLANVVAERVRALTPLVTVLTDDVIVRLGSRPFELTYTTREPEQRLRGLLERLAGAEPAA